MKHATIATAFVLLFALPAPAGVTVDFDREYDFATRQTFSWGEGTPASELNQKRIVRAVEDQLLAKNLTLVAEEAAEPDLVVVTHAASDEHTRQRANVGIGISKRISWGGISVGTSAPVGAKKVTVGTLVIEILDGETGDLVWQAGATETLDADPRKLEARIDKVVKKAFKKFPPKQGK